MPVFEPDKGRASRDFDYDRVAPVYDRHRRGRGPYFSGLCRLAEAAPGDQFLELGAGTGNNTQAVEAAFPDAALIALDASMGMLQEARAKLMRPRCVHGDACSLPFAAKSFHLIYSTYVIHHIRDIAALFREGHRVLEPRGIMATVTVPESFIDAHPMNRYFPSFARIDRARFQTVGVVEDAMRAAGFDAVTHEVVADSPRPINAVYVRRVAQRFISTYDLLPLEEFRVGVARLEADVARLGALPEPLVRQAVIIHGRKAT